MADFSAGTPVDGDLDVRWAHGVRRGGTEPPIQVHAYDEHTLILRQSKTTSFEAPFLYLLFGNDRALLLDTGATPDPELFPLRATVDRLVDQWLAAHPRADYALVVAHTHGHSDHIAGDGQFADRPHTTVVPVDVDGVRGFFGFTDWPAEVVRFDLGGRVLDVTGIPGHHASSIAIHDPWSGFLLTGDTVLRGRLYAFDFPAFADSVDRLVGFAAARKVTWVMGSHIEMTSRPGHDYPLGARYQPDEPPPQLPAEQLTAVRDAARSVAGKPGVHRFDDFVVYHLPHRPAVLRLTARGLVHKIVR
ncbi:MAG TPA: MBL fold metallo-hydrolase [Pseudonocardiaceae bacterium]|jgi:glyoxylase-like metal-dependent hydrolase (beta-lactamase superfamily II)|nr:MBL fold metallo-hydrolase [Pseudonocardiaceae bacterium]